MRSRFTTKAHREYRALLPHIQKQVGKQLHYLVMDLRYPSLHAKKYDESKGVWQARVNRDYRFYFIMERNAYVIISITKHPK